MKNLKIMRVEQIEAVMAIYSKRDLPDASREAIRKMLEHGYNISQTAFIYDLSDHAIRGAIDKITNAHALIIRGYFYRDPEFRAPHGNKKTPKT